MKLIKIYNNNMKTIIECNEKRIRKSIMMDEKLEFAHIELKYIYAKIDICIYSLNEIKIKINNFGK